MHVCVFMYVCMCVYEVVDNVLQDLVNFDDPLNTDAAEQFRLHPVSLLACCHWKPCVHNI